MTADVSGRPYLFDARSAGWSRTTGWERYTREIAIRIERADPLVRARVAGSSALPSRLWEDALATPLATRRARVAHFPTMPPTPWARAGHRMVYTLHDLTWWRHPRTGSRMGRWYYAPLAAHVTRGGAHIVADTEVVARDIQQEFKLSPDRVTVVPLGAGLPTPREPLKRPRPYLLTVATLEPRKNLHRLATAYERSGLRATHDLLIVGRVAWGRPPAGVDLLSGLDDAALAAAYAGSSAVVLASLDEGFGLPVVEAMQLGVPVVCSDIPVLREVSGGFAEFFDPTDLDAIIDGLRVAVTQSAPPQAAAWARQHWSWDRTVSSLSRLYRRLDSDP